MFDLTATLALLIPLAPFILGGIVIWTKHQQKMLDRQSQMTAEKAAQYAAQTERLEQRVRTLERIITDRGHDLANEIESLRDEPARVADRTTEDRRVN